MKKLIAYTLFTLFLVGTVHAGLFFAGKSVNNYRKVSSINIDKMGGNTSGIRKINTINIREKIFDPTEGLVGWWTFDGNATDSSGNNNDGTVNGATLTTDRNGNTGRAYSFDGSNDDIIISNNPEVNLTEAITVSLWVKPIGDNVGNTYQMYVSKKYNQQWAIARAKNSNNNVRWYFNTSITGYKNVTESTLTTNQWHHLLMTYDMHTKEWIRYMDGQEVGRTSMEGLITTVSGNFSIGTGSTDPNYRVHGEIDDVRIYNRALTADEVQTLYEKH